MTVSRRGVSFGDQPKGVGTAGQVKCSECFENKNNNDVEVVDGYYVCKSCGGEQEDES